MDETRLTLAIRFAAALGLGVILGLERERTKADEGGFAGVRTFGLIALSGGIAAYLGDSLGAPSLALVLFAAIAALLIVSYALAAVRPAGITTELSALLAFSLGFLCVREHVGLAAGLAVLSVGTLALRDWLHRVAQRIESADIEATLKFALVSLIILPIVPNEPLGPAPFDVLTPYKVWLMVVLISGLNFSSYLLVKILGPEHGIGLTGLLGGLVSSTAVTLGFAQRSREKGSQPHALALGTMVAWTIMFARIVVIVAVLVPALARAILPWMTALGVASLGIALFLWRREARAEQHSVASGANPFELGSAIRFGLLFGVIALGAHAAQLYFGKTGLYVASALAGLTDVDAITLSMAELVRGGAEQISTAARAIVIAALSNTVAKGVMAASLGSPELRRIMVPATAALLAVGLAATLLA
jgi:uncharacterized membrane protein (DUF4010 family)